METPLIIKVDDDDGGEWNERMMAIVRKLGRIGISYQTGWSPFHLSNTVHSVPSLYIYYNKLIIYFMR